MKKILLVLCVFILQNCGEVEKKEVKEIKNTKVINFTETCKDQSIGNLIEKGIKNHKWIITSEKEVRLNGNLGINIGPSISVFFIKKNENWEFYKFYQENSNNEDTENNFKLVIELKCLGIKGIMNEINNWKKK